MIIYFLIFLPLIYNTVLLIYAYKKYCIKKANNKSFVRYYLLIFLITNLNVVIYNIHYYLGIFDKSTIFYYCILYILLIYSYYKSILFSFFCFFNKTDSPSVIFSIWDTLYINNKSDSFILPLKSRLLYSILFVLGIVYMLLFFGIFETYISNYHEWLFDLKNLIIPLIIVCAIVIILFSVLISLFNKDFYNMLCIILGSVFVFMYIQNAFFNQKSVIIGKFPEYSIFSIILNCFAFLIFLSAPIYLYKLVPKIRKKLFFGFLTASIFVLLIQIAPVPFLLNEYINEKKGAYFANGRDYRLSSNEEFVISNEENVVVFVLDSFSNDNFHEYYNGNSDVSTELKDFVYYDNMCTTGLYTPLSLPFMLTDSSIDYSVPFLESNKKAWNCKNAVNFYQSAHDHGYIVNLYTDSDDYAGDANNMVGKIDNVEIAKYEFEVNPFLTYFKFVKLSLYKYLPIFMKELFFISGSDEINMISDYDGVIYHNNDFKEQLDKHLVATNGKRIIIYHLDGMHSPYLDAMDYDFEQGRVIEEELCFSIIYEYIDQLKEMGLYDSTSIIITADHGQHQVIYGSEPIMLIKPNNANGDNLRFNHAPGLLQHDLLCTILDLIGEEPGILDEGYSLLDLDENTERERYIQMLSFDKSYPKVRKCIGAGESLLNVYKEYRFYGKVSDIDLENDLYKTDTIYDFWW